MIVSKRFFKNILLWIKITKILVHSPFRYWKFLLKIYIFVTSVTFLTTLSYSGRSLSFQNLCLLRANLILRLRQRRFTSIQKSFWKPAQNKYITTFLIPRLLIFDAFPFHRQISVVLVTFACVRLSTSHKRWRLFDQVSFITVLWKTNSCASLMKTQNIPRDDVRNRKLWGIFEKRTTRKKESNDLKTKWIVVYRALVRLRMAWLSGNYRGF